MFLATFLIGLREGLEAALIVGILAAFLKRNGTSLRPLALATAAAVGLSILVGVLLEVFAQSLPQAQQEALETVIGVIAVVFVTTMILWMNTNARSMKQGLEEDAAMKLSSGGAKAMAGMAFLAVIKEGFETAVFLMAAFQASSAGSELLGLGGALIGILLASVIGYLIYKGGVRFDLGTFFKVTGPFLILVAAGFVANVFRTAHEAGWVNIGQLQVFDFSAFLSNGTVLGALVTGMFSIQPDPRLIEVIAYFAYLIPVLVIYCWPAKHSFGIERRQLVKRIFAGVCCVSALGMFFLCDHGQTDVAGSTRSIEGGAVTLVSTTADQAVLDIERDGTHEEATLFHVSDGELDGLPLTQWESTVPVAAEETLPSAITLTELRALNGGRLPSGLNAERTPGPFDVAWSQSMTYSARTSNTSLLRASGTGKLLATLTGGGIESSKTVNVSGAIHESWSVSEDETHAAESTLQQAQADAQELALWWLWIPAALAVTAAGLLASSAWDGRRRAAAQD